MGSLDPEGSNRIIISWPHRLTQAALCLLNALKPSVDIISMFVPLRYFAVRGAGSRSSGCANRSNPESSAFD